MELTDVDGEGRVRIEPHALINLCVAIAVKFSDRGPEVSRDFVAAFIEGYLATHP